MNASMKAEPAVQAERRSKEAGPERLGNKLDVGPASYELMPPTDKA
jgi:hypothetical protein